ncbi:MAG: DUF4296 domain-containing protein [Bacteroidales bacterium]|nr:DUF4296 domain-containing protein [Bacteroidales bacterium]
MKIRPLVLLVLVLAIASCARKARVIPAATMSDIYADMFMADQWLSQNPRARRVADTSNFYAPIFDKYGYTVEDYDATVRHYLRKPDKYAKILKAAGAKLNRQAKRLQAIEDAAQKIVKFSPYQPSYFRYDTLRFKDDTLGLWPNDSSFKPEPLLDSLLLKLDSLRFPIDTLKAAADTIAPSAPSVIPSAPSVIPSEAKESPKDTTIKEQKYGQEKHPKKVFLIHGSDDAAHRRHSDVREVPGGQSEPAR